MSPPSAESVGPRFDALIALIARLRAPGGCPWDREQTHESLKPMTLEEAYEVLEAIDQQDDAELAGELGDLLLQVVFHSQIAAEENRFNVGDVIGHIHDKMVRRHPHVFGDQQASSSEEVLRNWEALKQAERDAAGHAAQQPSLLDSVSRHIPATMEAFQMSTKVSRVGFDWPDAGAVLDKLREELRELEDVLADDRRDKKRALEELGDLLFAAVNVARLLGGDPESALKAANRKFRKRFAFIERRLGEQGRRLAEARAGELETLWNAAKHAGSEP